MVTWSARSNPALNVNPGDILSLVVVAAFLALVWSAALAGYQEPQETVSGNVGPLVCVDQSGNVTSGDDWNAAKPNNPGNRLF